MNKKLVISEMRAVLYRIELSYTYRLMFNLVTKCFIK